MTKIQKTQLGISSQILFKCLSLVVISPFNPPYALEILKDLFITIDSLE